MPKKDKALWREKGGKRGGLVLLGCDEALSKDRLDLLADARRELAGRVSEKRLAHSEGVSAMAVRIAVEYGVDPCKARFAGLVHDWNKGLADDELLAAGHAIGFDFPEGRERDVISLLHAPTGAVSLARRYPQVEPDILQAVARHTAGGPDMTGLDMVVYVADMLEPGRSWEGVGAFRDLIGEVSLEELYRRCYASTMQSLFARGRYVYLPSVTIWNDMVERA